MASQLRGRDLSARELVSKVMSPRIAVIASQGATDLCQANHLPSLVDLLKPFGEQIEGRGNTQEPTKKNSLFLLVCIPAY